MPRLQIGPPERDTYQRVLAPAFPHNPRIPQLAAGYDLTIYSRCCRLDGEEVALFFIPPDKDNAAHRLICTNRYREVTDQWHATLGALGDAGPEADLSSMPWRRLQSLAVEHGAFQVGMTREQIEGVLAKKLRLAPAA